jgi:predicted DNA binding CopG/RHH family protein
MPAPTTPYPVRLSDELRKEIKQVAASVGLPFPEVMRQALKLGLPLLKEKLTRQV